MAIFRTWAIRLVLGLAAGVMVLLLFYAEELWRGQRAWEHCRRNLERRGISLDWARYIPPPVADDENLFAVPEIWQWFGSSSDLWARLVPGQQPKAESLDPNIATGFLQSNAVFEARFDFMREALKRPSTRIPGSYTQPRNIPHVNFRAWFAVVRTMMTRARCHLLLSQPDAALEDIALLDDTCRRSVEAQKPVSLLAAWVDLQGKGGCADLIARGIRSNSWGESQLAALENRLETSNVLPVVAEGFALERAAVCCQKEPPTLEQLARRNYILDKNHLWLGGLIDFVARVSPRGWVYLGSAAVVDLDSRVIDAMRADEQRVDLKQLKAAARDFEGLSAHWAPKAYVGQFTLNLDQICQTAAYVQTKINETLVACALARYRLAQGHYPATLDVLAPRFIDKIPSDVIEGGPLHYRCSETNTFTVYSIGWNGRDDGGARGSESYPYTSGDWVWQVNL
jgi:hypothetical protein